MQWMTATPEGVWLVVILLGLAGMALTAYAVRALDALGSIASFLLGLLVARLGGLGWLLLLVTFTGIGFLVTRVGRTRKQERRTMEANDGERGLKNVLANGAAAGLAAIALLVLDYQTVVPAFVAAVAAVTADTAASEVGTLAGRTRSIVPPFRDVEPGRNGGVSALGQAAAGMGALSIGLLAIPLTGISAGWAVGAAVAGFIGCQLDSLLGATLERDTMREGPLSKEDVNFISSALPALAVLVIAAL